MVKEAISKPTSSKSDQSPALNGAANGAEAPANPQLDPEIAKKIATMRSHVRESFGKVVMAMMMLPRYRRQSLDDLQHLVLEPLIADRIAIAYPSDAAQNLLADVAGVAIWASVSETVDAAIRDQIKAGVFPIRLKQEEWNSGSINWLLDVIAPSPKATTSVIANFRQIVKDGDLRLHPIITKLVDPETLARMAPKKVEEKAVEEV